MNRTQELVLKYANVMKDTNDIAKVVKLNNLKVQSIIMTMARKNLIDKDKAKALLKDTNMVKFIDIPISHGLSKPVNFTNDRIKTISN